MSDNNDYKENHNNDSSNRSNGCHHLSTKTKKTTNVSNFPAKLHFMLNELQRDGLAYIASWQQHGRCFIVRNPKDFESAILPSYFQQSKFASFQRQLSFYGFRRICFGRDKGGYFHEHFLRGKEELAIKVRRTKVKGTGPRKPNSMESPVPNFYEMAFLPDTNKKNSNHIKEEKSELLQSVMDTHEYTTHGSSMKAFGDKTFDEIKSSSSERKEDGVKSMVWTRNQERLHQIKRLNEIDRDLLLLSHASYNIQNSCQASFHCISSSSSPAASCNTPIWKESIFPSQSSFLGLNHYPLAMSSRLVPLSSYNRTSATLTFPMSGVTPPLSSTISGVMINAAVRNYMQQQR